MDIEWEAFELARSICDCDHGKAQKLIDLIKLMTYKGCKMPDVKMVLPEDNCRWFKEGNCIVDVPDSVRKCNGKCSRFEESQN